MTKVSRLKKFADFYKRNNKKITVITNIVLLIFIIACFLLRNIYNFDYILLLISIFMLICLFNYKPYIFIKYFFSIFYCIFMLAGVFLCNNGNLYLNEIAKYSEYNGSFSLAILYFIIFFVGLIIFDHLCSKKIKYYFAKKEFKVNKLFNNLIYFTMFLIGCIMFLSVIKYPSFKLDLDRFEYATTYLPRWLFKAQTIYIYLIPLLLFPIIYSNKEINYKKFIKIVIAILPFLLYGIWTGNKFGLFFNIFILLLSPLIVYIGKKRLVYCESADLMLVSKQELSMNKWIKKILLFSIVALIIILLPYYLTRGINFKESLLNRTAQQGQLWWATFTIEQNESMHLDELEDEINPLLNSLSNSDIGYTYGVYKIMKLTTPYNMVLAKLSTGSRYSAQGLEIAFYYFKYLGIIIHAILRAFIEAFLVNLLIKYVFSYRMLETMIVSRFIIVAHFIFTQGDLYILFSWSTIITIVLLIILEILFQKYVKKRAKAY